MTPDCPLPNEETAVDRIERILRDALAVLGEAGEGDRAGGDDEGGPEERRSELLSWRSSAAFVVESMSSPGRFYHGVDHVFQVWENAQRQLKEEHLRDEPAARGAEPRPPPAGRLLLLEEEEEEEEDIAILALAAAFHDAVYLALDGNRLSPRQLQVLKPYVVQQQPTTEDAEGGSSSRSQEATTLWLRRPDEEDNDESPGDKEDDDAISHALLPPRQRLRLDLVCRMFDALGASCSTNVVAKGDVSCRHHRQGWAGLNLGAANELLSALAALECVGDILTNGQAVRLVACLEASVPFRRGRPTFRGNEPTTGDADPHTTAIMEELRDRWGRTSIDLQLGLSEKQVDHATKLACRFAHADLGSFASPQVEGFLDSTWALLPEWFPPLRPREPCDEGSLSTSSSRDPSPEPSLRALEGALVGLLARYPAIDPNYIFPNFRGSHEWWERRTSTARQNLDDVGRYARARLAGLRLILDAAHCLEHCRGLEMDTTKTFSEDLDRLTLRYLRRVESGVPLDAVPSVGTVPAGASPPQGDGTAGDGEARHTLRRCLTNTGRTRRRSPCPWGDAVDCRASALVHSSLTSDDLRELSKTAVTAPGERPLGHWVRRLPVPARRALLDAVLRAASSATNDDGTNVKAPDELRASLFASLDCADPAILVA